MILQNINGNLIYGGISISDWMQAIGALIAVIAAIVGFFQLFRKDNDKQKQIGSLAIIAQQSENHNAQLSSQVDQMIESNRLQTEYLRLFQKSIANSEMNSQYKKEQKELDDKRRKFEIKPRFEFGRMQREPDIIRFSLINCGETAKIISCEELEKNTMKNTIDHFYGKGILKNETLPILFTPKTPEFSTMQCYVEVKIIYEDVDNNQYYQIIGGRSDTVPEIQKIVEIPKI